MKRSEVKQLCLVFKTSKLQIKWFSVSKMFKAIYFRRKKHLQSQILKNIHSRLKISSCVYWGCINVFRISSCLLVHVCVSTLQMVTLTKQKKKHPSSWVDAPVFVPVRNKSDQSVLVLYPKLSRNDKMGYDIISLPHAW